MSDEDDVPGRHVLEQWHLQVHLLFSSPSTLFQVHLLVSSAVLARNVAGYLVDVGEFVSDEDDVPGRHVLEQRHLHKL